MLDQASERQLADLHPKEPPRQAQDDVAQPIPRFGRLLVIQSTILLPGAVVRAHKDGKINHLFVLLQWQCKTRDSGGFGSIPEQGRSKIRCQSF